MTAVAFAKKMVWAGVAIVRHCSRTILLCPSLDVCATPCRGNMGDVCHPYMCMPLSCMVCCIEMDGRWMCGSPLTAREYIDACIYMYMCVPFTAPIITVWPRLYVLLSSCQRLSALYIGFSTLCVVLNSCCRALLVEVPPGCCLQEGTSVLVWAGVAFGWLIYSLLLSALPLYV